MSMLTDTELAGLNLVIEMKKAGSLPPSFVENASGATLMVHVDLVAVLAAVADIAGGAITTPSSSIDSAGFAPISGQPARDGISLEELLDIRARALSGRRPVGE